MSEVKRFDPAGTGKGHLVVYASDFDAAQERIAQLEAQLADVLKANQYHCGLLSESGERIRTLEAALREGRKWIGDGEYGDGLHRDHWTPKYNAVVDMIDACLTAALSPPETPDAL